MTFEQILARANEVNPNALFHIWVEYADGKRGYGKSCTSTATKDAAVRTYEKAGMSPIVYDRNGGDV